MIFNSLCSASEIKVAMEVFPLPEAPATPTMMGTFKRGTRGLGDAEAAAAAAAAAAADARGDDTDDDDSDDPPPMRLDGDNGAGTDDATATVGALDKEASFSLF